MAEIKFLRGSSSNWNGVEPKIESYFYLVSNADSSIDLYLGEKLLAKGTSYAELTAEVSRSIAEDERLAGLISSLTTDVEGDISAAVASLQSLIQAEQTRAEGQEAAIRSEFAAADAAEKARAETKESELADAIAAEETRAKNTEAQIVIDYKAADSSLEEAITVEKGRAEGQEAAIRGEFAAADTALKASILGEVSEDYDTLAELAAKIGEVEGAAKSYSLVAITEGLSTNVKEAFKLVDEDGVQVGDIISIYKDSSLISVALSGQTLNYTYVLADGSEETVGVDMSAFLLESEFKNGLQVNEAGEVSVKVDGESESFLSVSANGVKLSGVQSAIDAAKDEAQEYADDIDSKLSQAIAAEKERAEGQEAAIREEMSDSLNGASELLEQAINGEIERAQAAEKAIQDALDVEIERADIAEKALQDALDTEVERAKALKGSGNIEVTMDVDGFQTIGMVWGEF